MGMDASLQALPPRDPDDAVRVEALRYMRRLLYGEHHQDVKDALLACFGLERSEHMKWIDDAANPVPQLYTQLSALYPYAPRVTGPFDEVLTAVERAGHWTMMHRNQRDTLCLQDLALVLDANGAGGLQIRAVFPDLWYRPRPSVRDPRELAYIGLWLQAGTAWELHEWQIEDEEGAPNAFCRVRRAPGGVLETGEPKLFKGGTEYPHQHAGKAFIPVILYHAADTGRLTDWRTGYSIARGAVRIMVFLTSAGHVVNDASWIQRVIVDGHLVGTEVTNDGEGSADVVADPTIVMMVRSEEGKQALVTAFAQPSDPEAVLRFVAMYAQNWAAQAGVRSAAMTKSESDIRSGYSLAVARESVQEQQAVYAPTFRRSDAELLTKAAWMLGYPEATTEDWGIDYQALRLSPTEMASRLAAVEKGLAMGVLSPLSAVLMLNPQWTTRQAEAELERVAAAKAAATPGSPSSTQPAITITPSDLATIVTVDEARVSVGLPALGGADGALTIAAYKAKYATTVAAAAAAADGAPTPTPPAEPAQAA